MGRALSTVPGIHVHSVLACIMASFEMGSSVTLFGEPGVGALFRCLSVDRLRFFNRVLFYIISFFSLYYDKHNIKVSSPSFLSVQSAAQYIHVAVQQISRTSPSSSTDPLHPGTLPRPPPSPWQPP